MQEGFNFGVDGEFGAYPGAYESHEIGEVGQTDATPVPQLPAQVSLTQQLTTFVKSPLGIILVLGAGFIFAKSRGWFRDL